MKALNIIFIIGLIALGIAGIIAAFENPYQLFITGLSFGLAGVMWFEERREA